MLNIDNMETNFIRIKEAAGMLGVTPLTLRNWDKKGLLAAYRHPVNNYRLYRAADIRVLLSKIEQPTAIVATSRITLDTKPINVELPQLEPIQPPVQKLEVIFEDEV